MFGKVIAVIAHMETGDKDITLPTPAIIRIGLKSYLIVL